jgi:cysteine desulfurase
LKKSAKIKPFLIGGGQEYEKRAGTQSIALIASLAKAVELACTELCTHKAKMNALKMQLQDHLLSYTTVQKNGAGDALCNTTNLYFEAMEGDALLLNLDLHGICASLGSACSSGSLEPSHVLLNMGLEQKRASSSLRFSLSRFTTQEEICQTLKVIENLCLLSV